VASCNTCDCWSGECTEFDCGKGCSVGGRQYIDGDRFYDSGNCLTTCDNGQLVVDDRCGRFRDCRFKGYAFRDGETFTDPENFCDVCTCSNRRVECTEVDCFFCRYKGNIYPPGPIEEACTCEPDGAKCPTPS